MEVRKARMVRYGMISCAVVLWMAAPAWAADSVFDTDAVVVTATRTEAELKAVPSTVEVITAEDIERLGAADVYQALKLASNVDVRPQAAGHNVQIRGTNSNDNLILINGLRMADEDTNETANVYALDRINLSNIERIEIVRGAASAQYGSDAIGGVINIITKESDGKPSFTVGASAGTEAMSNYYRWDLGRYGKFSGTIDARFEQQRWRLVGEGPGTYYHGPRQTFGFSGKYTLDANRAFDFRIGYYNENSDINLGSDYTAFGEGLENGYVKARRFDYSLGYSGKTDRSDYMFRTYYSKLEKKKFDIAMNWADFTFKAREAQNDFTLWGVEGKDSIQLNDRHLLTVGAEYRSNTVEGDNLGSNADSRDLNMYAGYIQDEWLVSDSLLVIPSVRYDHYDDFGSKTTPKIGATYFINDTRRIKANWGKGFKAPTLTELYGSISHFGMFDIVGNPDLEAEESNNWDIGYEAEFGKTAAKVTYFHNKVDNLINWTNLGNRRYGYVNVSEAVLKGVELEVKQKISDNWQVRATSNWLTAEDGDGNRLESRAKNISRLELNYDSGSSHGVSVTLWDEFVTDMRSGGTHGTSSSGQDYSYNTLNLAVNKRLGERAASFCCCR